MKLSSLKIVFSATILSLSSLTFALPDITGNWQCKGYDPFQKKEMTVSGEIKKTGDTYSLVNWKNEGSSDARSGTALHNSHLKNSLAVMFWSNENAEDVGFGLYQIKSNNQIEGKWTMKNGQVAIAETCKRVQA